MTYQYIDLSYLKGIVGDDADTLKTMLDMLVGEVPEEIKKMQALHQKNDWEELFQVSHKMKTTLGFVGNGEMDKINKSLEHASRHKVNLDATAEMVEKLTKLSESVVKELQHAATNG